MSWVCLTCHQATSGYPPQPTLNPLFRKGYCAPEDTAGRTFQQYINPGPPDPRLGRELKEAGISRANTNVSVRGPTWTRCCDAAIRDLAAKREPFTSEDVTRICGMPPTHPSAVGARMNTAAHRGLIVWTGEMRKANRPNQHSALLKVWRGV